MEHVSGRIASGIGGLGAGVALLLLAGACGGSGGGGGGSGKARLRLSGPSSTVSEAGGTATLIVERGGSSRGAVTVDYATSDGTALSGIDYTATAGTLAWADGDSADRTIAVPVIDNGAVDGDRTFTLTLSGETGAARLVKPSSSQVTVTDDEAPPAGVLQLSMGVYSVAEGAGSATIDVTRTGGASGAATVDYSTADASAMAGTDYTTASGTLAWPDGDTSSKSFSVTILDDAIAESTETVLLSIQGATGASLGATTSATLDILDDDAPAGGALEWALADTCVLESATSVSLEISRAGGTAGVVSVDYSTVSGTATAPSDFASRSDTAYWADGDGAPQTIQITLTNTPSFEPAETFTVVLSNPQGGAVLGSRTTTRVHIGDDLPGAQDACFGPGGAVISDPSAFDDVPRAVATDATHLYVAGTDRSSGLADAAWRIEKRALADGALDPAFGSGGSLVENPSGGDDEPRDLAVASGHLIAVGTESTGAAGLGWRLRKIDVATGLADAGFGTGGSISFDPGAGDDAATAIAVDSTSLYVFGVDTALGPADWRVDKRALADGGLDGAFGPGGTVLPGTTGAAAAIAVDAGDVFLVGTDSTSQWVIEKRGSVTGAPDAVFGTSGRITFDPSGEPTDAALALALGAAELYVGGTDGTPGAGDDAWRVERRSRLDGALNLSFGSSGTIAFDGPTSYPDRARALLLDGGSLYVAGEQEDFFGPDGAWRIERRLATDGSFDVGWGQTGFDIVNPTVGEDEGVTAVADASASIIIIGSEIPVSGDARWRIEKRRE